ncbi:MAG: phosphoenolpyruvate--protein phosphotransferase [Phycisphaerales bacterium]
MPTEFRFTCTLRNGFHARPASMLADVVRRYSCSVTLVKELAGARVDARSVLSVIGLDVKHGDDCVLIAEGADAAAAIAGIEAFIRDDLSHGDELPPSGSNALNSDDTAPQLPVSLRKFQPRHVPGRSVCAGIAVGVAVIVYGLALCDADRVAKPVSIQHELDAARRAIDAVRQDLRHLSGSTRGKMERELLHAHEGIADDPALWHQIEAKIRSGATAPQAVVAAAEQFADHFRTAASAYIRDRVVDVQDVAMQILDRLTGGKLASMHVTLTVDSIVFAEALTANQLLRMDRRLLRGLVLGHVGATSHTVILARSLQIPTIINAADAPALVGAGTPVVVDAVGGFVITAVTPEIARHYQREQRTHQRRRDRLAPLSQRSALTTDGQMLEVGANAATADEIASATSHGADGIGLLRTELLFLDRPAAPTEEEQFEAYLAAVAAAKGRPIIIRTFDIGGDKPAEYLRMPEEDNPFLGLRGLRLYEALPDLLRIQLRAILRASAQGSVKIMAPMVALPTEAAWFRAQVQAVQAELKQAGTPFDPAMPIGIMIEIPAAALAMDQLCDEVDFFSIGTNDLCQYWMAVDRGNHAVANLYNAHHPSFLRLLRVIVQGARARSKWIGVCGEMAGQRANLPLMIGLGVDEISVAPGDVSTLKAAVQSADASQCRTLLDEVATCRDVEQVEKLLAGSSWRSGVTESILDPAMIDTGETAATKEEAIKAAVDLLFVAGRTENPRQVEEAVWAREQTYSTGLGYGFAVPHCKTDAVSSPSLVAVKLTHPIEWGSMDGRPVQTVLLLAIPASDTTGAHMKVFAKLARRLMHDSFRDQLTAASDPKALEACLRTELEIQ